MSATTKPNIRITISDGWIKVLDTGGVVTTNNSCYYAYSDNQPIAGIEGNYTADREITNPSGATLWMRANLYTLIATPNEE